MKTIFYFVLSMLLMAAVAQGQKLSEPTWNFDGAYSCAIGKVCRTPTQKEIDAHKLSLASNMWTATGSITVNVGPCLGTWTFDAKTNTCSMNITFSIPGKERVTCSPLVDTADPTWHQAMKCSYTPKAAKP